MARKVFKGVNTEDFWSLAESFGRAKIKAYIQLNVDRRAMRIKTFDPVKLRYLTQFLYGPRRRVTDTRQLSALSRVLGSQVAARKLERGATLDEATLYVESKQETLGYLVRHLEKLFQKIRLLSPGREEAAKILKVMEEFSAKLRK